MKQLIILFLLLVSLFGCSQQASESSPPSATPTPSPIPQPLPQPSPQPPSQPEKSGPNYVVSVSVLQFDQQVRYQDKSMYIEDKRKPVINKDSITKSYGIEVSISVVSSTDQPNRPIKNPEKAMVKLVSDQGKEFLLKYNSVSQQDYDAMPTLFQWVFITSDKQDPYQSRYAYLDLNASKKLKGNYKLIVDIEGDGEVDGEKDILVPGLTITKPTYSSKESVNGFNIEWSQSGELDDFMYGITIASNDYSDNLIYYTGKPLSEPLTSTNVFVEPTMIDEDATVIEPGMFLINFKIDSNIERIIDDDAKKYIQGVKSDKKIIFHPVIAKEANLLQFKVGDFCHCDDLFQPIGSCTVDELDADPLCS